MSNYKAENNKKLSIKTDIILEGLPPICHEFFTGNDDLSDNTKLSYATQFNTFLSFLVMKKYVPASTIKEIKVQHLVELEPKKIDEFIVYTKKNSSKKKTNLSNETLNHYIAALSSLYRYICDYYKCSYNPMSIIKNRKRNDNGVTYLKDSERERFITIAETVEPKKSGELSDKKIRDSIRNTAIIKLFLSTGIRVSELVGIDIKDINFEEHSVSVDRKGGSKDNEVYFSDDAENALKEYLAIRDEYIPKKKAPKSAEEEIAEETDKVKPVKKEEPEPALFLSGRGGKRMTVRGVEAMIKTCTKKAKVGKNITPHKLRSSFAMHRLENNGFDLKDVQDALNHKRITSSMRYIDQTSKERKKRNRNL